MQAHQWHWGINQWVEFLRDKEIPVLPRTRAIMAALEAGGEDARDNLSARDMANIVYADPYLALKLLRRVEQRRSRQLGHDTTTPLAAVLQGGYDELQAIVAASPQFDDVPDGCHTCEFRSVLACSIARSWANRRADVSPDEVSMAALLVETGELLLWHFAAEMTDKETQTRDWNDREGNKRTSTEIVARQMRILTPRGEPALDMEAAGGHGPEPPEDLAPDITDEDVPF